MSVGMQPCMSCPTAEERQRPKRPGQASSQLQCKPSSLLADARVKAPAAGSAATRDKTAEWRHCYPLDLLLPS